MKETPMKDEHLRRGAKMVEFAGWRMPLYYSSILDEVRMVRNRAGLFDVSHMGEIEIKGDDFVEFVDYLITNNFSALKTGDICYTVMCNDDGGIIDDLLAYRMENKALLVVNAANEEKDFSWILERSRRFDVTVENISSKRSLMALQGPDSEEILEKFVNVDLGNLKYYSFAFGEFSNGVEVLISRTGYTGEDGFEIMCSWEDGPRIWNTILDMGEERVKPCGLGARDVLRLEAGYLLYGNDMDETTNPFEVGLGWIVKLEKEEFIGKKALMDEKERLGRKLRGFVLLDRGIPRHGDDVISDDVKVGVVTSGTHSPTLNRSIGMCIIDLDHSKFGERLKIRSRRGKEMEIEIVRLPFYRGSVKKKS